MLTGLMAALLRPPLPADAAFRGIGPIILSAPAALDTLDGLVRDHAGPLAQATIVCHRGTHTWQATTNRHGAYRLALASGRYTCRVTAPLHQPAVQTVQIHEGTVAALTLTLAAAPVAAPAPAPVPATPDPGVSAVAESQARCSWLDSAAAPGLDANAHYWGLYLAADPQVTLSMSGTYPLARYVSLQAYTQAGGLLADLYDAQFPPLPPAVNPFVAGTARGVGTYQLQLVFAPRPTHPVAGTLYLNVPRGAMVALAYRVYLPDTGAGPAGSVGLPVITAHAAATGVLAPCPVFSTLPPQATASAPLPPSAGFTALQFSREGNVGQTGYLNGDAAYLATYLPHTAHLYVVRFKAPTTPRTLQDQPLALGTQLRYWSLCVYDWLLHPRTCIADEQAAVDATGTVTFVLGPAWARPRTATPDQGVTWIGLGAFAVPYGLVLREVLPAPSFPWSAAAVPVGGMATASMGAYAPTIVACTVAQFEQNRCASV